MHVLRWALTTAAMVALALISFFALSRIVVAVCNGQSGRFVEWLLPRV
jgi:hypothetical protein